jgi:hypothetical protein
LDILKFAQKAFLIEDLSNDQFVTTLIPPIEDRKDSFNDVQEGYSLITDDFGSGYFIQNPDSNWVVLREFKPTGKVVENQAEKELIIKCMEVKKEDQEKEFLEEKKRWNNQI